MLFGRKKEQAKTALIIDVENGSVATALARLEADGSLRLMQESRRHLPVRHGRSLDDLSKGVIGSLSDMIKKVSEFASLARHQAEDPSIGHVSNISVFLSPPWGNPNLKTGKPDFLSHMQGEIVREVSPYFDAQPKFFTGAGAAAAGMRGMLPFEDKYLLCIVTHEMTELLLVHNGAVVGHASVPHGMNLPLRTLKAHGNLSDAEARSALNLLHLDEPLSHAADHYAKEFKNAAQHLFGAGAAPERVWVISPAGEYFARTLGHESLSDLFPEGGVVRTLKPLHAAKHLDLGESRDMGLILAALYVRYTH